MCNNKDKIAFILLKMNAKAFFLFSRENLVRVDFFKPDGADGQKYHNDKQQG